jgi:hypothetical protein
VNASRRVSRIVAYIVMTDGNFLFGCLRCMVYLVHHERNTRVERVEVTHPASCASCPRMIDSKLFRSRNLHAASYLLQDQRASATM